MGKALPFIVSSTNASPKPMNEDNDADPGELGLVGLEMLLKREVFLLFFSHDQKRPPYSPYFALLGSCENRRLF